MCHVLFAKEMKKFSQIWPQQLLKHFTAGYRGFPPCTQSQYPINRETGYSNVLSSAGPDLHVFYSDGKSEQTWTNSAGFLKPAF